VGAGGHLARQHRLVGLLRCQFPRRLELWAAALRQVLLEAVPPPVAAVDGRGAAWVVDLAWTSRAVLSLHLTPLCVMWRIL
jgi:hypothetical protein